MKVGFLMEISSCFLSKIDILCESLGTLFIITDISFM